MTHLTIRIIKGAALLDTIKPDWRDKVNTEVLSMDDVKNCILGQVFGDWDYGFDSLWPDVWDLEAQEAVAYEHGFDVAPNIGPDTYDELNAAWRDFLNG